MIEDDSNRNGRNYTLSVIVPCYNETETLQRCIARVMDIAKDNLTLEIIIVDDCSTDGSIITASALAARYPMVRVVQHKRNMGKGAAIRSGIFEATGEFVAIQDADLEYNPKDLLRLLEPLAADKADVVFGSRFLAFGAHRVLYFWHSVGNKFLTLLSNMLTDLNLTDMECCYKVFRRDALKDIVIEENRFGFEPEIVAKMANKRLRIYEMPVSYDGRTYSEGKKITWKDGLKAIYCIFHYNLPYCPPYIQFAGYLFVGVAAAIVNFSTFVLLYSVSAPLEIAAPVAFILAAAANYLLSILFVFRHKAKWSRIGEIAVYCIVVLCGAALDLFITKSLVGSGSSPEIAKITATALILIFNFVGRRYLVFPLTGRGDWHESKEKP